MKTAEDEMQDKIERHAQEVQMLKLQGYVGIGRREILYESYLSVIEVMSILLKSRGIILFDKGANIII